MKTFDFFQAAELPAPPVTDAQATEIADTHFGLAAHATALGSQQDANFLLSTAGGPVGVLKIANPAFSRTEIEAQDAAAAFLADTEPGIRTGRNLRPRGGPEIAEIGDGRGGTLYARVLTYLPGGTMSGDRFIAPRRWAALGTLAGRACRTLANFDHPGVDRVLQWDLRFADRTIELLAPFVSDDGHREMVRTAASQAWARVRDLAAELVTQVIHCDITDDNVVCGGADDAGLPDGIIDFGDLTRSWSVGELAIATSAVLRHHGGEPAAALPLIAAFHRQRPLSPAEVEALWPLVVLRAATLVVSGHQQTAIDAGNDYARSALAAEWRIFERAISVPAAVMAPLIADALEVDLAPSARGGEPRAGGSLLPGVHASAVVLDLSTDSDGVDAGRWLHTDCEDDLARAALDAGASAVLTRYAQPRLTRAVARSAESPATVPTGVDVWLPADLPLLAPWPCLVSAASEREIVLTGDGAALTVRALHGALAVGPAVATGHALEPGAEVGSASGRLWVQLTTGAERHVPAFVRPEYAPGWLALTADPGLGPDTQTAPAGAAEPAAALTGRRARSLAAVQEQYYPEAGAPRVERGWREFLLSTDARSYLDMVNNVTSIGHGHPGLADAVARQWRRLNTNSRFNYAVIADFSERLAATLPEPLDTVFLVNSGSEAVDLGLRLALAATGRRDVVAVAEAYHGWTYATDAISTSVADNPNALSTRPDWVHTVPSPNSFRGIHRGHAAQRYGPEAAAFIAELASTGRAPAAFICEPFYGNAGGVALPDGYLAEVYAAVRAAGGLTIADEVQVGYGRLGHWFWGFQQQGVVPDIVTVAKAMGNGHPLGAVITTRAVAESYRTQGYFFSSAGGSPVSCVVGLTVLDVIEREGLQHNALAVGDHLRERVRQLAGHHPIIGAVHGSGLYLGVELVRDRQSLEPATAETAAICDRMLDLGVIVQPTGDHQNVLKIKPPMCFTHTSADFFVDMLDRVLSTGW
ncbi:aminotransferase [Mycolicibacterium palauense]|uniref:aminotransferase n=1 Tax=Mycolicibacterium palauense TaxID=2034511 RepID=UPI001FE57C5A|nr:aminotransferase [Mycolicibacterium palauense]